MSSGITEIIEMKDRINQFARDCLKNEYGIRLQKEDQQVPSDNEITLHTLTAIIKAAMIDEGWKSTLSMFPMQRITENAVHSAFTFGGPDLRTIGALLSDVHAMSLSAATYMALFGVVTETYRAVWEEFEFLILPHFDMVRGFPIPPPESMVNVMVKRSFEILDTPAGFAPDWDAILVNSECWKKQDGSFSSTSCDWLEQQAIISLRFSKQLMIFNASSHNLPSELVDSFKP